MRNRKLIHSLSRRVRQRRLRLEALEPRRVLAGSISGWVYVDSNYNGVRENHELGIPSVPIFLDGAAEVVVETNGDGHYSFDDLADGTYTVEQLHPWEFLDHLDTAGEPGIVSPENDRFGDLTVTGGNDLTDYNFTERGLRPEYASLGALLASADTQPFVVSAPPKCPGGQIVVSAGLTLLPNNSMYDFGDVPVGLSHDVVFSIKNDDVSKQMCVTPTLPSGAFNYKPPPLVNKPGSPVLPSHTENFTIRFEPEAVGDFTTRIKLRHSVNPSPTCSSLCFENYFLTFKGKGTLGQGGGTPGTPPPPPDIRVDVNFGAGVTIPTGSSFCFPAGTFTQGFTIYNLETKRISTPMAGASFPFNDASFPGSLEAKGTSGSNSQFQLKLSTSHPDALGQFAFQHKYPDKTDPKSIGTYSITLKGWQHPDCTKGVANSFGPLGEASSSIYQTNVDNPSDVNDDGVTTPLDALMIFNELNLNASGEATVAGGGLVYLDVSADGMLSPIDGLLVVNVLNGTTTLLAGAGEGPSVPLSVLPVPLVTTWHRSVESGAALRPESIDLVMGPPHPDAARHSATSDLSNNSIASSLERTSIRERVFAGLDDEDHAWDEIDLDDFVEEL